MEIKKIITIVVLIANIGLVKAQYTAIPDTCFEQHLIDLGIDSEGTLDGKVLTADIEGVTELIMHGDGYTPFDSDYYCYINSLQGINDFIALKTLDITTNGVEHIDVSNLPNLKNLYCNENFTKTLALPPSIEVVYARFNLYNQDIDFSQTTELKELYLDGYDTSESNITNLDMSGCINLLRLSAYYNNVVNLNVSNSPLLEYLSLGAFTGDTGILTNFIHNNPNLKYLVLIGNLSVLDLSEMVHLKYFHSIGNPFETLDLTSNINLNHVGIGYNLNINSIDLRNNNNNLINHFGVGTTPNLTCIYVDDAQYSASNDNWNAGSGTFVETEAECNALAINETTLKKNLLVYPNPVKDILHISNNNTFTIKEITLYNVLGEEIIKTTNKEMDLSSFTDGIYIVKIKTSDDKIISKKIMKTSA